MKNIQIRNQLSASQRLNHPEEGEAVQTSPPHLFKEHFMNDDFTEAMQSHPDNYTDRKQPDATYSDTLNNLKGLKGHEKHAALTRHLQNNLPRMDAEGQLRWLSELSQQIRIPRDMLKSSVESALKRLRLSGRSLKEVLEKVNQFGVSPEQQGLLIYRWFNQNGAGLFRDRYHTCYLVWNERVFEIGHNQPFNALLWKEAGITFRGKNAGRIWAVLQVEAHNNSELVKRYSWLRTDSAHNRVYLHPNAHDGSLICISPEGISPIANGNNEDKVLLTPAPKMQPFELQRLTDDGYRSAWTEFDRLVLQNLACSRLDQLLCGCWVLCYPLIDFIRTRPHLRFEGISGAGKTRGLELLSHFVYGDTQLKMGTDAANYADASRNPIVMLDNVETKNFSRGLADFFLTAVTGIRREKRRSGTLHDTVDEKVSCLLATTGIENLGKTEHINRMLIVEFDRWKFRSPNWSERVYSEITASRPELCSAHMMLASRVLARIAASGFEYWVDWLESEHPGHTKDRANSFLALMALILDELLPIIQPDMKTEEVLSQWVKSQDDIGRETARGSNQIVGLVESIRSDWERAGDGAADQFRRWGYDIDCHDSAISGTATRLLPTFRIVARRKGLRFEFVNAMQLARRIADAEAILQQIGVKLTMAKDRTKTTVYTFEFNHELTTDALVAVDRPEQEGSEVVAVEAVPAG